MLKGPIAKATIQTSVILAIRLLVQAGTLLVVARMLGNVQFGFFAANAALAVLIGTFSTFGTHLVLLGESSKDARRAEDVLSYAVPTTLTCSSLLFILYLLISLVFFSGMDWSLWVTLCIGIAEIFVLPLYMLPTMRLLAAGKTAFSQLVVITPLMLRMVAAVAVLIFSPENMLVAFAILYVVTAVACLFLMKCIDKQAWLTWRQWRIAKTSELKSSAGYATLALTAAGPSELDKLLAVKLLPLGVSGLYVAASRVIGASTLPVIALLLSAFPRLFRASTTQTAQNNRLLKWLFAATFIYGTALSGLLWLLAPVCEWLFGEQYQGIADMLRWLCLAIPGLALRIAAGSVLMSMEMPWIRAGFELFGMLSLALLAVVLSRYLEDYSMAIAFAGAEWTMAIIGLILLSRGLKSAPITRL